MDSARHVMGCHSTQRKRLQNAFDDVASPVHQSLVGGDAAGATAGGAARRAPAAGAHLHARVPAAVRALGRVLQVDAITTRIEVPIVTALMTAFR